MTKINTLRILATLLLLATSFAAEAQRDPIQPFQGTIGHTLDNSTQWYPDRVRAPKDAPNILWIMLDDVGFGASSAFGGLIETPTFETLAKNGLRYTNFHTAGICSPTRAALLTGRNAHAVAMGHHAELGTGFPGYTGDIPFEAGTVAEIFRENGYNTYALGKWHGQRPIDLTAAGPFNRYPTGRGFDHFYGFLGGATDQWHPSLIEETSQINIEPNKKHLNELLADKAISYIANQKSANADKPFFLYLAPGATHSPHHAPKEWIAKYKGKFDGGWDKYREEVFKRQQALGLVPKETKLPPRMDGIKAWDSLTADEKTVFTRFFEVYAGFLSYTDYEIGRIVNYLRDTEQLENTAIFIIIGDNGGSKEGTYTGILGIGDQSDRSKGSEISFLLSQLDKFGTEQSNQNYPLGWSQATNTPFRYWKSDVNSEGASHNPLIVHYPRVIKQKGQLRTQYHHVTDLLPTVVELTGVKVPEEINGYKQMPFHGTSLAYSFESANAPTTHPQQYYELHGGRSIYKDGWKASVYHPRNMFGEPAPDDRHFNPLPFDQDKWELYNLNTDWNETTDLASKHPEKLEELKKLFDEEAKKYNVYPLKNYRDGLTEPKVRQKTVIYEGSSVRTRVQIGKNAVSITAVIEVPESAADGVIFANGGLTGGTALFLQKGKLHYALTNGVNEVLISNDKVLLPGKHEIRIHFANDNKLTLAVDGAVATSRDVASRNKYLSSFSSDGVSIGVDLTSPVTKKYEAPFIFTGKVKSLTIEQDVVATAAN